MIAWVASSTNIAWWHSFRHLQVVSRLQKLAENGLLPTLPWVLAASARLSGLKPGQIEQLEVIATSDPSMSRRTGAIEILVQCTETTSDWRLSAAQRLVDALAPFITQAPTNEVINDVETGMQALGSLRVSSPEVMDLCRRLFRHESERMRIAATYGIGGLPADAQVCLAIVAMLGTREAVGAVRGGLVDALHRVLSSD